MTWLLLVFNVRREIINIVLTTLCLVLTTCKQLITSMMGNVQFSFGMSILCYKHGEQPVLLRSFFCSYHTINMVLSQQCSFSFVHIMLWTAQFTKYNLDGRSWCFSSVNKNLWANCVNVRKSLHESSQSKPLSRVAAVDSNQGCNPFF